MTEYDCARVLLMLDSYIDRELSPVETAALELHLEDCVRCAGVMAGRAALRERLRHTVRDAVVPEGLAGRVRASVRKNSHVRWQVWWGPIALAAAILLAIGAGISYQAFSSSYWTRSLYSEPGTNLPGIVQVGLTDHVKCAVPRKYRAQPESFEQMARDLGPKYADLLPVVEQHIPSDLRVVMAHQCRFEGRDYVHLILRSRTCLASVIVTGRGEGEAFEGQVAAMSQKAGTAIYSTHVRPFSIAGFETKNYLVYLVSDLDTIHNLAILEAMTPKLRDTLRKTEI